MYICVFYHKQQQCVKCIGKINHRACSYINRFGRKTKGEIIFLERTESCIFVFCIQQFQWKYQPCCLSGWAINHKIGFSILTNIMKLFLNVLLHEDVQMSGIHQESLQLAHTKQFFLSWPIVRPQHSVSRLINTENHRLAESFDISWKIKKTITQNMNNSCTGLSKVVFR